MTVLSYLNCCPLFLLWCFFPWTVDFSTPQALFFLWADSQWVMSFQVIKGENSCWMKVFFSLLTRFLWLCVFVCVFVPRMRLVVEYPCDFPGFCESEVTRSQSKQLLPDRFHDPLVNCLFSVSCWHVFSEMHFLLPSRCMLIYTCVYVFYTDLEHVQSPVQRTSSKEDRG